jgi:transposase
MLSFLSRGRVFLAVLPADMRRSIDGLSGLVRSGLGEDPLSGDLFAFTNRRRDRIKILLWDRSGFWVLYKRLEKGTFAWPGADEGGNRVVLSLEELSLLLEGIELSGIRRRKWYSSKVA